MTKQMRNNLLAHLTPATLVAIAAELVQNHTEPMKRGWNFHTEDAAAAYLEVSQAGRDLMGEDVFFDLLNHTVNG